MKKQSKRTNHRVVNKVNNKKSWLSSKYFTLLTVCIVTGFIIGFSYNLSKDKRENGVISSSEYEEETNYRQQLIVQQKLNNELIEELSTLEQKIRTYEKDLASDEVVYNEMLRRADELRMLLGQLAVKGKGISIALEDGEYNAATTNPNEYIIHESHLFKLINELKIAGAEAIAINGQRLTANSYIVCNGPVITVDGKQYPAPFVVEAIGNPTTLLSAIEISGGVMDQLLNDRINVKFEIKDEVVLKTAQK
jgi:uncharacterized protein YlxW (UPF0749 family)